MGQEVEQEVPGAAGNPGQEVERDFRGDMCVSASQRPRVDMISEVEISPQQEQRTEAWGQDFKWEKCVKDRDRNQAVGNPGGWSQNRPPSLSWF